MVCGIRHLMCGAKGFSTEPPSCRGTRGLRSQRSRGLSLPADVMRSKEMYREFYDRLGRDYDETGFVHGTDPRRHGQVLREILPFAADRLRMLDVGCNDGVYTIPYAQAGGPAKGIDISGALVEKARAKTGRLPVAFEVADVEEFDEPERYDLVLMSETLEHLRNPDVGVRNVVRALKPGGTLFVTTPSPYGLRLTSTWRYVTTLIGGLKLVEPNVDSTDHGILGEQYGLAGFAYRHDGYYLFALKRWLEGFGLVCESAYTAFHGNGQRILSRTLRKLERLVPVHRIPYLNLFGANDYLLLGRIQ